MPCQMPSSNVVNAHSTSQAAKPYLNMDPGRKDTQTKSDAGRIINIVPLYSWGSRLEISLATCLRSLSAKSQSQDDLNAELYSALLCWVTRTRVFLSFFSFVPRKASPCKGKKSSSVLVYSDTTSRKGQDKRKTWRKGRGQQIWRFAETGFSRIKNAYRVVMGSIVPTHISFWPGLFLHPELELVLSSPNKQRVLFLATKTCLTGSSKR